MHFENSLSYTLTIDARSLAEYFNKRFNDNLTHNHKDWCSIADVVMHDEQSYRELFGKEDVALCLALEHDKAYIKFHTIIFYERMMLSFEINKPEYLTTTIDPLKMLEIEKKKSDAVSNVIELLQQQNIKIIENARWLSTNITFY